jgi:phasin
MAEDKAPADQVRTMMAKNLEQARGAMTSYFQFLENSMSTLPLGATDQVKAFKGYVERNVAASFEFSDKLLRAKDFQDILRIQTEFFQTQLRALTEKGKEIGDTAAKPASEVINVPIE